MKKFITTRINKPQWRVTVPNLNTNFLLRRSPFKDDDNNKSDKESKRSSSGFYDLQEAQTEYDKTRSLPNSVYVVDSTNSDEEEEVFEDARDRHKESSDTDMEVYADIVESTKVECHNIDRNNSQFEYDVPRISFKFFEKHKHNNGNNVVNSSSENTKVESEVTIMLETNDKEEMNDKELSICHPSERFVCQTEIFVNSLEDIPIATIKSAGSDPNIVLRDHDDNDSDDGLYKVPRSLKKIHRLSQSLNDFDIEHLENKPTIQKSNHSSIEHISASQIIIKSTDDTQSKSSETMDYCKVRSKLPIHMKRPSMMKKPKKAIDKWNSFKLKFNQIMVEQAAQQKVGAFGDKEKVTINFEEMYKNSKSKCKKVLQSTSKMFHHKNKKSHHDNDESICSNSEMTSVQEHVALKASDIEYKLNITSNECNGDNNDEDFDAAKNVDDDINNSSIRSVTGIEDFNSSSNSVTNCFSNDTYYTNNDSKNSDFDIGSIKSAIKKKLFSNEGQNGFEDLRRYVKQGGDFCKELSTILQERAEAETQYAKSLSKLSSKLSRACRDGVGGLNEAWKAVALELETRAEGHRLMGIALMEETAKPLKSLTESQHRIRKQSESGVDKAARLLADWRTNEAKSKKHSHTCARENEKLQDAAILDTTKFGKQTISKSTSLIHLAHLHGKQNTVEKDNAKLEVKKKKAEDAVKKADIEYYSLCVRAERARLEWESSVMRGASTFQALEEERLHNLKSVLTSYLHHSSQLGPRLIEASARLKQPINQADPSRDLVTFQNLRQSSQQVSEQLLPDFYCEHITLAMNRERRKQALVKLLHLIRQDIERERKSKNGLENLSKAIKQTPSFGSEDSQQTVTEKLYHMKSLLTYLEGARYKVQSALAELDSRPRNGHPLAPHITVTRDKSGLQQSVLKVPQWLRNEWTDDDNNKDQNSPISAKSIKSDKSDNSDPHNNDVDDDRDWLDRGAADGNSNQPDSDFDEFSSQCSSTNVCSNNNEELPLKPIATCRAIYPYTPNMNDELPLKPGDFLSVYRQQDDGWWLGECNGNVGIFPATYVELVTEC